MFRKSFAPHDPVPLPMSTAALAVYEPRGPFHAVHIDRSDYAPGADDGFAVSIDILYCGVCHSDLHWASGDWGPFRGTPLVPGHEIAGVVTAVGASVTKFVVGDRVGVGCMTGSCRSCAECADGLEQLCERRVLTYMEVLPGGRGVTYGGYSSAIRVQESFVVKFPESLRLERAAPLLCAGITTYYPLKYVLGHGSVDAVRGKRVGVVGLGGLGHVAVLLAKAMGAAVVVLSSSDRKRGDATALGADAFAVLGGGDEGEGKEKSHPRVTTDSIGGALDLIIDTVSAQHEIEPLLALLKKRGSLHLVGVGGRNSFSPISLVGGNKVISASVIGGIADTQEMLDFCGAHGVEAWTEVVACADIQDTYRRLERSDVKFRFVLDIKGTLSQAGGKLPGPPAGGGGGAGGAAAAAGGKE